MRRRCWPGCATPACWRPPDAAGHPAAGVCWLPARPWPSRAPSPASAPSSWRMTSSPSPSPAAPPRRARPPAPTWPRRRSGRSSEPGRNLCVLGHAGPQEGGAQTGIQLAAKRAGAVAAALAKLGIERDRIRRRGAPRRLRQGRGAGGAQRDGGAAAGRGGGATEPATRASEPLPLPPTKPRAPAAQPASSLGPPGNTTPGAAEPPAAKP